MNTSIRFCLGLLLCAAAFGMGSLFLQAPARQPAVGPIPDACPQNQPLHICVLDVALSSIQVKKITEDMLSSDSFTTVTGSNEKTIVYNVTPSKFRLSALFYNIAEHGTPAQIERALGFFDVPLDKLFIPERMPDPSSKDHAQPQQDTTLHLKLILLAALKKEDEISHVLKKLQKMSTFKNRDVRSPQSSVLQIYLKRHTLDDTLAIFKAIYDLGVITLPAAFPDTFVKSCACYLQYRNLLIELLYADRFQDALGIHQMLKHEKITDHEESENLLSAHSRRSQENAVHEYYKQTCKRTFDDLQKHQPSSMAYITKAIRLFELQCSRDDKEIAKQISVPANAAGISASYWVRLNEIVSPQHAHASIDMLATLETPLTLPYLETLSFLNPYIAADACRARGDEKCVGYVADIVSRQETFRTTPVEIGSTPLRFQIEDLSFNGEHLSKTTGTTKDRNKSQSQIRFTDFDAIAFKREFGLLPIPPVPELVIERPNLTQIEIKEDLSCDSIQANDPTGLERAACVGWHLFSVRPPRRGYDESAYLRRQHMLNLYTDGETKKGR